MILGVGGGKAFAADAGRGAYLFAAAGCKGCHTDKKGKGEPLAGGRRLKTPFGVFVTPNITPDPVNGIGKWTDADFVRALKQGVAPDGSHYFPAFPYPSYTAIAEPDLLDIKAYIFAQKPVSRANEPHEVPPPFGWRFLVGFWKMLYFTPGGAPRAPSAPSGDPAFDRGAYLVLALGHCGECHTPRDILGGRKQAMHLAGTAEGPEGGVIPNITPETETGIGKWSAEEIEALLKLGMLPDADFVGSAMGEVVEETTGKLTDADRKAIVKYLRSVPPVRNRVEKPKKKN